MLEGSIRTVTGEIAKYKLDLVGAQRSDGTEVAPNKQVNIYSSMEKGMRIMVQVFSYRRESYQQLRG
jgi:hypothetical protein